MKARVKTTSDLGRRLSKSFAPPACKMPMPMQSRRPLSLSGTRRLRGLQKARESCLGRCVCHDRDSTLTLPSRLIGILHSCRLNLNLNQISIHPIPQTILKMNKPHTLGRADRPVQSYPRLLPRSAWVAPSSAMRMVQSLCRKYCPGKLAKRCVLPQASG